MLRYRVDKCDFDKAETIIRNTGETASFVVLKWSQNATQNRNLVPISRAPTDEKFPYKSTVYRSIVIDLNGGVDCTNAGEKACFLQF